MKALKTIILLITVCFLEEAETGNGKNQIHETLLFTLPDTIDHNGIRCSAFSDYYCLHGYFCQSKQSDRAPQWSDSAVMTALLESNETWKKINWFDFGYKTDDCCKSQVNQYEMHGQKFGLSPLEYLDKMTHYNANDKNLNQIKKIVSSQDTTILNYEY
ncbi:uncharacterized protein LOC142335846 [Convolutriloba macropyga]|uniref:uncharacterized protein LOC142335846 n=1 Tax=Convolutriloba macropyga TaxID=536237 RepID=UPI003F520067